MRINNIKGTVSAIYMLAITGGAVAIGIDSPINWAVVAAVAVLPPLAMLKLWNEPTPTMSESINRARR